MRKTQRVTTLLMSPAVLLALLLPALVRAEVTPAQGPFDPRVRIVDYNPQNVVKVTTFYGISTHIQLGEGETVIAISVGDKTAWDVISKNNNLFIKPLATKADTNVTVVTDRHTYQFAFVVEPMALNNESAWRDPNLVFSLSFRFPEVEVEKQTSAAIKTHLDAAKKEVRNIDYWVAGSADISPTAARDDGRFTYLTFSNNRDMPAIYTTDTEGNDALIDTHVEANTIVVHRVVRRLTLRKGNASACLVNKAFDPNSGADNSTGTIAPGVERVIKGGR